MKLLKWVGGKSKILNELFEIFPKKINNYHEIFLGGGSVLFHLLEAKASDKIVVSGNIYAYDVNEALIYLYKNIQNNYQELFAELNLLLKFFENLPINGVINRKPKTIVEANTKENYYYYIRMLYNNCSKKIVECSAMFIFLNKTCFRGLYRVGPNGFNVPYGNYKSVTVEPFEDLSILIKDVIFECLKFEDSLKAITVGDFVYLDPPYIPESKNSFVNYNKEGFDEKQHILLFKTIKESGVNFIMSNSDTELVNTSFNDYNKKVIECRRAINSKNPGSTTNELIISAFR